MDTPLYKLSEENFGIISFYYDLINEKSEKYYNLIFKFNEATKEYCSKIKNIFGNDIKFPEDNNNQNKENNLSIKKRASTNIIKANVDINEAKMKSKNFDISPIEYNIGVINNLFLSYYQNLSLFSESLGLCSVSLKDKIDKTKTTINEIKSNYNKDKSKFEEKYSTFDTINKEMSAMYFDQEKNIVDFMIKSGPKTPRDKDEDDLILKIFDSLNYQETMKNKFKGLGNFGKAFNDSYNEKFEKIKNATTAFYKDFESFMNSIFNFYKKSFFGPVRDFVTDKNNTQLKAEHFNENLNSVLKKIDENFSEINFDIYKINTIKYNTKDENHLSENGKNLMQIIRKKKFDEKDIFYVAKKMNNFEFVDKKEYILDIEKEKIKLLEKLNKLFRYANKNRVKKNSENKSNNNNEDNSVDVDKNKVEEPNDEDFNYICKLMKKKEYRDYLLTKLNNYRAEGSLEMPENVYNYFVQIFLEIMKYLVKEKEKDSFKELNIDYTATRYIFILSQTFYYKKDKEKIYLQNGIKNQKIFQSDEFWIKLLEYNIKQEMDKLASKSQKKFDEKEKGKEICIMQILPYLSGFDGFGVSKEAMDKITNFFIKKYELNEESQKLIFEAIKMNENQ